MILFLLNLDIFTKIMKYEWFNNVLYKLWIPGGDYLRVAFFCRCQLPYFLLRKQWSMLKLFWIIACHHLDENLYQIIAPVNNNLYQMGDIVAKKKCVLVNKNIENL